MTDIDYAAEAKKILHDIETAGPDDNLPYDWSGASSDEQWLVHASLEEAQVHATLALVEQQRIANLIALHRHEVEYDIGGDRSYLYKPGTEDLRDDIKKGLGL